MSGSASLMHAAVQRPQVADDAERAAWVVLASVDGVGMETFGRLLDAYGGASEVLRAARNDRLDPRAIRDRQDHRLAARVRDGIVSVAREPRRIWQRLAELSVWTLTPLDRTYPRRLRDLAIVPPVLFGWGDAAALESGRSLAIVGTRRPSPRGRALASRAASAAVDAGAVVVSGLAIGIDGAAHAATVERGGRTVAVLGSGHAHPGPRSHRRLVDAIRAQGGAVVSELAPDARSTRGTFPRRNRIVSALGDAVLIIEAPVRSGALITARHALEQGRALFVAPGRPDDPLTAGCLALLRETPARPMVGVAELLVDLGYGEPPGVTVTSNAPGGARRQPPPLSRRAALSVLSGGERVVAERLCVRPASLDSLVEETRLPPAAVSGAVTLLLLRGWVQSLGPAYLPSGPLLAE